MASITIRNLDDEIKERLRVRAASRGRSMEAEVREILCEAINAEQEPTFETLGDLRRHLLEVTDGGFDLTPYLPKREPGREPPDFS